MALRRRISEGIDPAATGYHGKAVLFTLWQLLGGDILEMTAKHNGSAWRTLDPSCAPMYFALGQTTVGDTLSLGQLG